MLSSLDAFCTRLSESALSQAIQTTEWVIPAVQTVHIVAVAVVVTSILEMDLRLLGVGRQPIAAIAKRYLPPVWAAFAFAVVTGGLMFCSNPATYAHNGCFRAKMTLIAFAGLNMLGYHRVMGRDAASWHTAAETPLRARLVGGISLELWLAIAACGWWIGFTINAPT